MRWRNLFVIFLTLSFYPASTQAQAVSTNLTPAEMLTLGQRIYEIRGANTCVMCHGKDGNHGSYSQAAKLQQPATWKLHSDEAHVELIELGAVAWNTKNSARLGVSIDPMMYGLQQAPTLREVQKLQKEMGLSKETARHLAARAVFEYVKTLAKTAR